MPIFFRIVALILIASTSTGCATILAGKTQAITLNTSPSGARCELNRDGRLIGTVENTPGVITLDKTKHDIDVTCQKEGFSDSKSFAESGTEWVTLGNIIIGGLIGWGVDSAVGADNKYPEVVNVTLNPSTSSAMPSQAKQGARSASYSERPEESSDLEKRAGSLSSLQHEVKIEPTSSRIVSKTERKSLEAFKVVVYQYDAKTQRGMLMVDMGGHSLDEVREWVIKNIGRISSTKEVLMEAGQENNLGGRYRLLDESIKNGMLTVRFTAGFAE